MQAAAGASQHDTGAYWLPFGALATCSTAMRSNVTDYSGTTLSLCIVGNGKVHNYTVGMGSIVGGSGMTWWVTER